MSGSTSACEKSPEVSVPFNVKNIQPDVAENRHISAAKDHGEKLYVVGAVSPDVQLPLLEKIQALHAKDLFDKIVALILLVLASPIMLATFFCIKLVSPGNVIFKQERLTLNGKRFIIYKFRSMHLDAEKESGAVMAGENDPRVFPLGRFMRKTRIDELPQIFNVLKGEMSIVGPRPERPEIARELERELHGFHRRMKAKAGLTGLAQVRQGYCSSVASYRKKIALDLLYIRKQSLLLDLWILLRTVAVVIFFRGAR